MDGESEPPEATERKPGQARGARVTIVTDLPDKLPVIDGEAAIIRAYLGELVARIAMNDNEDKP